MIHELRTTRSLAHSGAEAEKTKAKKCQGAWLGNRGGNRDLAEATDGEVIVAGGKRQFDLEEVRLTTLERGVPLAIPAIYAV